ncbi:MULTISPECIES: hypothetical protein [Fischerella]|uniref:Uncharacterized protein n=1 Tax=Fischerella muscicola CCMEE 5323 TaxID=2019572 RepID=A0A2N6K2B2_FISMU|nr:MULTISPECIES: hypothetical protein [Fischerella]MBD2432470.1 hypothetical protein [Fischerella sp. FACHB-380]PLZ89142.1 hypothetical protein CEN44_13755 [Fischerella muscicola CCMEE 5323]
MYLLSLHQLARVQITTSKHIHKMGINTINHFLELDEINFLSSQSISKEIANSFQKLLYKSEQKTLRTRLKLKEINLIIFPSWSHSEEILYEELTNIIISLSNHPQKNKITLLIENSDISDKDVEIFLYSIAMDLMINNVIVIDNELQISLIGKLNEIQWKALIPCIQGRVPLVNENKFAINSIGVENFIDYDLHQIV